jgi:hypothetical protein
MNHGPRPSQARIQAMVAAASLQSGIPAEEICFSRLKPAVRARHAVWRELRASGFGYSAIAQAWGVDHSTIHFALNGKPSQRPKGLAA